MVVNTWPRSTSRKTAAVTPSFDNLPWCQLPRARGHVRGPLSMIGVSVFHVELRVLSLLVEDGRSTFEVMAGSWANF